MHVRYKKALLNIRMFFSKPLEFAFDIFFYNLVFFSVDCYELTLFTVYILFSDNFSHKADGAVQLCPICPQF